MTPDIGHISALLTVVAAEVILPRFRNLAPDDIESKDNRCDPDDIVTVVDREVEDRLRRELRGIAPRVPLVGEEACFHRPQMLGTLEDDGPAWVLDPIDGTKNFAEGRDGFGVMLAWVSGGRTRASWILLPAYGDLFVAEWGSGAFRNGDRLRVPDEDGEGELRGSLHTRYMSRLLAEDTCRRSDGKYLPVPTFRCAAMEYPRVLNGSRHFTVYPRLYPWDHAPGALILSEAGGRVEHLDGSPYGPRSTHQVTVVAANPAVAERVRSWLAG